MHDGGHHLRRQASGKGSGVAHNVADCTALKGGRGYLQRYCRSISKRDKRSISRLFL